MALIKTCKSCGKRTDRPPFNQHGWIDYLCFKCGGGGSRPGSYAPFVPKEFKIRYVANATIVPKQSQSVFSILKHSIRRVA